VVHVLSQREVYTESFYTVAFYPRAPKLQVNVNVEASSGASCKLYLQAYDVASESFATIWNETSADSAARDWVLTDSLVLFPPSNWAKVYVTPRMRFYVELSGSGAITMGLQAFELVSTRQVF